MRIKNILVPTDFSENAQVAFENGQLLARQLDAKLYLLHVQDETTLRTAMKENLIGPGSTDEELQTALRTLIETRFSQMCAGQNRLEGLSVECCHRRGVPGVVIVDYASEINADVIVMGMRGTTADNRVMSVLLGSVTESVMRKSPCPTLVVRLDQRRA